MSTWKRIVLFGVSAGAGFVVAVAALASWWYWYSERPKPWNRTAIRATFEHAEMSDWFTENAPGQPALSRTAEAQERASGLVLYYTIENSADTDYFVSASEESRLDLMAKTKGFRSLVSNEGRAGIVLPVYVPAGSRVRFGIRVKFDAKQQAKQVEQILDAVPVESAIKHAAWDAFFSTSSAREFDTRFQSVLLPAAVTQQLRHLRYGVGGALDPEQAKALIRARHPDLDGFVLFDKARRYQIELPRGW